MKKVLLIVVVLFIIFSFTCCSEGTQEKQEAFSEQNKQEVTTEDTTKNESKEPVVTEDNEDKPVVEEVKGVTIPKFEILINDISVTQDTVAALPAYGVVSKSVNSVGTEKITTYIGFKLKDILKVIGLEDKYTKLEAVAEDGYTVILSENEIYEDSTLLAITKDGLPFSALPWLAPCSNKVMGQYLKNLASINVS